MARYEVGPLVVDIDRFEALVNGRLMSLKPKAFDALAYFCQHPDRVLSKQDLLDAVWPGLVVTESSLFKVVQEIRRALDQAGCITAQIENVPGRGYRLVLAADATVSTVVMAAQHPTPSRATPTSRARGTGRIVIALAILLALMLSGWWMWPAQLEPEKMTHSLDVAMRSQVEALAKSAPAEAIQLLDKLDQNGRSSWAQLQRARALLQLGRTNPAVEVLERAFGMENVTAQERLAGAQLLASALMQTGRQRELIQRLHALYPDNTVPTPLWLALGNAHLELGDLERANDAYQRVAAAARADNDSRLLTRALGNLGNLAFQIGDINAARDNFEEALSLSFDQLDVSMAAGLRANLGNLEQHAGDYQRAARYYAQAFQAMEGRVEAVQLAMVLLNFANTHMEAGNLEVADYYYDQIIAWAEARGLRPLAWTARQNKALGSYQSGDFAATDAAAQGLLMQMQAEPIPELTGLVYALQARARASSGDPLSAMALLEMAELAAREAPTADLQFQIELARGRILLSAESFEKAERALSRATELSQARNDRDRLEALRLHAHALAATRRIEEAEQTLRGVTELSYQLDAAAAQFTFRLDTPLQLPKD